MLMNNEPPGFAEAQKAQYRLELRTDDSQNRLQVPRAHDWRNGGSVTEFVEPAAFFNRHEGTGGAVQFVMKGDIEYEVLELKDLVNNRTITDPLEWQQLIESAQNAP